MEKKISVALLSLCLLGISYLIYWQRVGFPAKLERCGAVASGFERARHAPKDDGEVTDQDVSSYMKNVLSCLAE
jgi:hypothetical protein